MVLEGVDESLPLVVELRGEGLGFHPSFLSIPT
jgi:hypothetical protein